MDQASTTSRPDPLSWITRVGSALTSLELSITNQYILLALITLLATAVRFYRLGEWSFWGDEIITVDRARELLEASFAATSIPRRGVSLVLIAASLKWLGINEWSSRLVPALVGVISIPVFYFPTRKIFGAATGLLSALLLAISPWHLYWSQNARFYTFLLFFYTLALFLFYLGLEEDRPWLLLAAMVCLGLAIFERLTALLFVPVAGLYVLLMISGKFGRQPGLRLRNLVILTVPGLVSVVFFAGPFITDPSRWGSVFGWVNTNPFWIFSGFVYYVGIPTICMGLLGAVYLASKRDRASLLFSLNAFLPLVSILGLSTLQYAANRYIFVSLVSWTILASIAVKELIVQSPRSIRLLGVGVLAILVLGSLSENTLYYLVQNGNRDDWRSAFEFIERNKQPGDVIVSQNRLLADYYLQEQTVGMSRLDPAIFETNPQRVWFVVDLNVPEKYPSLNRWIMDNTRLRANMDVHVRARNFMMRVYLYDPEGF